MYKVFTAVFLLLSVVVARSQSNKALQEGQQLFNLKRYEQALPLLLEGIGAGTTDNMVNYQVAVCFSKASDISTQVKAITYFEKALQNPKGIPSSAYYELGSLYHRNEQLDKALEAFTKYKTLTVADKKAQADAARAIEMCHNAAALMSVPREIGVHGFSGSINSSYTEYNPVVSADESMMAYTALRPNTGRTRSGDKFIEQVYISYNTGGTWSEPKVVPISADYNVGSAGISPDGQKLVVFIGGADDQGNLFQITRNGQAWSNPSQLTPGINTKFLESTASITPDGKIIYFASNRPGGKGGMDIWKTEMKTDGSWSAAINLGPEVNSKDNEDAPFIHPDQKTLFFTSDGHNTMGGRDIFQSKLINGVWTKAENMGYPVNTTSNDNYFTLIADGTRGYFSSDRKGGQGAQDIYYLDMPANASGTALTMIKGRILNGETGKSIPTKMYVVDNETKKKLDFVYNPDPVTGDYLIILPPAKNYDIIIESEGFLPYTLNVNVPNQTYFYELYQQINLKTIKQFDVVVGQEVQVKNAFYDTNQDVKTELRKTHEAKLVKSGNVDVYDMMLDLMAADDTTGINYLVGLIEHSDPIDDINFDEKQNSKIDVGVRTYYFDESDESKFEQKVVDGKTIFSLPTMVVADEIKKGKDQPVKLAKVDPAILSRFAKIFFDAGKSDLKPQYNTSLDELLTLLNQHPDLSVEISGFASAEGTEELNRELSNKRAIAVLDYLNHHGIVRRRIIAKGYGATRDQKATKEEGRRVEVRMVAAG